MLPPIVLDGFRASALLGSRFAVFAVCFFSGLGFAVFCTSFRLGCKMVSGPSVVVFRVGFCRPPFL